MEFLFYRVGSVSNVSWLARTKEDPARTASDFGQGKSATLQWSRSNWNRCEALFGPALCHRFGALAPRSTKLLPGWRRGPAIGRAGCSGGQRLNKPGIADQLLFLSRQAARWMRLRAWQSIIELALLSRLGATSGATNRQGHFLRFHDSI